ncbi:MAG: S41 family peptidase [Planctomycetota bacterium]|nr:S41 family peptidase [Planctomycetota bacterium]
MAAISTAAFVCGCQSNPQASTPTTSPIVQADHPMEESQALLNGMVFDQVWVIIRDTHPDPSINLVSWNETRLQFRNRAVAATDAEMFRTVLRDMLQTLGESHFAIIPNSVSGSPGAAGGWSGLTVQVLDDDVIVTRVADKSPANIAGIKTGWKLISSEGDAIAPIIVEFGQPRTSLERLAREQAVSAFLGGRPGMSPKYLFVDSNGQEHEIIITFEDQPGELVKMGNLPPFSAESKWFWLSEDEIKSVGCDPSKTGRIGYLSFTIWMTALSATIDDALNTFRSADGIVIDLRGNPGGLGLMATGVAGHFLQEPTSLGTMRGRDMKLDFRTNPRTVDRNGNLVGVFTGPVAILVDGHTGSTSEIFAAGLLDAKRAQPFGQTTAGAALPATTHNLKNGDVLLHAIGDFRTPSGNLVEGIGVSQQVGTAPTRSDYTSSPDCELRDALHWISHERTRNPSEAQSP